MADMGGSAVIEQVLIYDPQTRKFQTAGYDAQGRAFGPSIPSLRDSGPMGMIVYAKAVHTATYTSQYCGTWQIRSGINLTGTGCPVAADLTGFDLLPGFVQEEGHASIQRYNPETGEFETANLTGANEPVGIDFAIQPGEGYLIHVAE